MKKLSLVLILALIVLFPNLVSAAWWNPSSWSFWPWNHEKEVTKQVVSPSVAPTGVQTPVAKPKPPIVTVPKLQPPVTAPFTPPPVTENHEPAITDADRQTFGYHGTTYLETLNALLASLDPAARQEFLGLMSGSSEQAEAARLLVEDLMNKYEAGLRQNSIAQQRAQLDCLMAPSPDDERTFDPETKDYLRNLRCGVATAEDERNYNLSQLRRGVDRLPPPQIPVPSFNTPPPLSLPGQNNWHVRWEGNGMGTIITPNGQQRFHCESSGCQSY